MQKVLILTHFFPPCNLTAAQRSWSWTQDLHQFGYHPIIVTRHWTNGPEQHSIKHEKHEHFEIYFIPCPTTIKERFLTSSPKKALRTLSKAISFFELVIQNLFLGAIPYRSILRFADNFLTQNKDITKLIISANPFSYFGFGYLLNKKHRTSWIADYRDDWNTSNINRTGLLYGFLKKLESSNEKRWLQNAACFTSVSPAYVAKIQAFIKRPGHVLLNGYNDQEIGQLVPQQAFPEFTIVYNGTLYETQPIELFLSGLKLVWDRHKELPVKLYFLGLAANPDQTERVKKILTGYLHHITITERVNRAEALAIQQKAALMLLVSHSSVKGIPSSKLYEYIGLQKPILVCPNDHDIIEQTISQYGDGCICENAEAVYSYVVKSASEYNPNTMHEINKEKGTREFSRKKQTGVLAALLDSL